MLLCKNKQCTKKTKCARTNPKRIVPSSQFGKFSEQGCSFFVARRSEASKNEQVKRNNTYQANIYKIKE